VNHPVRRRILELLSKTPHGVESMLDQLKKEGLITDDQALKYHLDFLLKASCIELTRDASGKIVKARITREGQVVDYLEK